jgi:hypothetical protein
VKVSRLYLHEIDEFEVAVAAYERLWDDLRIEDDLGNISTRESRNVVRRVRLHDSGPAVMKVAGNVREPGEGEVLAAWYRSGLPCVEPLDWGFVALDSGAVASYVLTRFIEAPAVGQPPAGATVAERRDLARRLVQFMTPFHEADVRVARSRTWQERLNLHLQWTLPLIRGEQLEEPTAWKRKLGALSDQGRITVHGDPAANNVLELPDGRFVLLDPPGALSGMPEADAGQICAQVGGAEDVEGVVAAVCDDQHRLDPTAVAAFAGMNFLVWSGYFLAEHPNPDADAGGPRRGSNVANAKTYLRVAAQLLDRFPN